jgi:hypothetical protein
MDELVEYEQLDERLTLFVGERKRQERWLWFASAYASMRAAKNLGDEFQEDFHVARASRPGVLSKTPTKRA